jgi:hypothetical protein
MIRHHIKKQSAYFLLFYQLKAAFAYFFMLLVLSSNI